MNSILLSITRETVVVSTVTTVKGSKLVTASVTERNDGRPLVDILMSAFEGLGLEPSTSDTKV